MMTLTDISQTITALAALGAVFMSARNGKKIQEVHLSINSRMTQLLEATGASSRAEGARLEREEIAAAMKKVAIEGQITVPEQHLKIEKPELKL